MTFEEAELKFLKKTPKGFEKKPCKDYSSLRKGGWIIRDTEEMTIGWVGKRGDIQVYDYRDRVPGDDHQIVIYYGILLL